MTSIKKFILAIVLFSFLFAHIASQQEAIELSITPEFFESHESEDSFKRFDVYYPVRLRKTQSEIRDK